VQAGNSSLASSAAKIKTLEQRGDEIIHEIYTRLNQTCITPLDPQDIIRSLRSCTTFWAPFNA